MGVHRTVRHVMRPVLHLAPLDLETNWKHRDAFRLKRVLLVVCVDICRQLPQRIIAIDGDDEDRAVAFAIARWMSPVRDELKSTSGGNACFLCQLSARTLT